MLTGQRKKCTFLVHLRLDRPTLLNLSRMLQEGRQLRARGLEVRRVPSHEPILNWTTLSASAPNLKTPAARKVNCARAEEWCCLAKFFTPLTTFDVGLDSDATYAKE